MLSITSDHWYRQPEAQHDDAWSDITDPRDDEEHSALFPSALVHPHVDARRFGSAMRRSRSPSMFGMQSLARLLVLIAVALVVLVWTVIQRRRHMNP